MITFIRSMSELMALTESRDTQKDLSSINEVDSGQRKRYIRSLDKNVINLANITKPIRHKRMQNKDSLSKLLDLLDCNNQIQSSFDQTLLEKQRIRNQQDVA